MIQIECHQLLLMIRLQHTRRTNRYYVPAKSRMVSSNLLLSSISFLM